MPGRKGPDLYQGLVVDEGSSGIEGLKARGAHNLESYSKATLNPSTPKSPNPSTQKGTSTLTPQPEQVHALVGDAAPGHEAKGQNLALTVLHVRNCLIYPNQNLALTVL